MLDSFSCPVCDANEWERVRDYRYSQSDKTRYGDRVITPYLALRRRVLFEVWFPGAEDVRLSSVMCRRCGFMTYTPRPSVDDVDAKYRFLQVTEKDIGGQKRDPKSRKRDRDRAEKVYRRTTRHLNRGSLRVLDVGGGNGKMLLPFIERGHLCSLVDYNVQPIEGVKKIADRLEDVPADDYYDAIVCSHVMEHLAEPDRALGKMATLLSDDGVIYGEVPLGVWGGIGIEDDPVTHINFFTKPSYEALFLARGFRVLEIRQTVGVYNRRMDVVYAVAKRHSGCQSEIDFDGRPGETKRLLNLTTAMKLGRLWRLRRIPPIKKILRAR